MVRRAPRHIALGACAAPGARSFADNLWHITKHALAATQQPADQPVRYFVDHGKEHVGQAAEIITIIAYDQSLLL